MAIIINIYSNSVNILKLYLISVYRSYWETQTCSYTTDIASGICED